MYLGETISEEETTAQTIDGHICGLLPAAFDGRAGGGGDGCPTRSRANDVVLLLDAGCGRFFSLPRQFPGPRPPKIIR